MPIECQNICILERISDRLYVKLSDTMSKYLSDRMSEQIPDIMSDNAKMRARGMPKCVPEVKELAYRCVVHHTFRFGWFASDIPSLNTECFKKQC